MLHVMETLEERLIGYAEGILPVAEKARVEGLLAEGSKNLVDRLQHLLAERQAEASNGYATAGDVRANGRLEQMIEEIERRRLLHRVEQIGTPPTGRAAQWVGTIVGVSVLAACAAAGGMWFYLMQRGTVWNHLGDPTAIRRSAHKSVAKSQAKQALTSHQALADVSASE